MERWIVTETIGRWIVEAGRKRSYDQKKAISGENGSSLIEVVIAMVLLAVLVTGLNACVLTLINSNMTSKEISMATASGNQLLETLRKVDYSSIVSNSDVMEGKFLRSWNVTDCGNRREIALSIQWPAASPRHIVQMSTIIAKE